MYRKGPFSEFQPGAPHNLNPPLVTVIIKDFSVLSVQI